MRAKQNPPEIYKIIFEKIKSKSFNGTIKTRDVVVILRFIFRVPRQKVRHVLKEMQDYGFIELRNCKFIYIEDEKEEKKISV